MIDLIDFGCGNGNSTQWGLTTFKGATYLSITNRENDYNILKEKGFNVMLADITKIKELPACKYITMVHFLEHLNTAEEVRYVIELATRTATDFLFIRSPFFDKTDYLREMGFKLTWSEWTGVHNVHTTTELITELIPQEKHFGYVDPITDSSSEFLFPIDAELNTTYYYGEKNIVQLEGVYREMYCFVKLRDIDYWDELKKL